MSTLPQFTTFSACEETFRTACDAGADLIFLEDSSVSIRHHSHSSGIFRTLCQTAQTLIDDRPIILGCNIDMLAHDSHLSTIDAILQVCADEQIIHIRIQDPALQTSVLAIIPNAHIHLATETGNANCTGHDFHASTNINRIVFTNETPASTMSTSMSSTNCEWETQVFGPVLLQYSDRRLLAAITNGDDFSPNETAPLAMQTTQGETGRRFRFSDSLLGSCMFDSADRSLLSSMNLLAPLQLTSWLFDGRGENPEYLKTAMTCFRKEWQRYQELGENWEASAILGGMLKSVCPRALRPGFFRVNKTDRFDDEPDESHRIKPLARVLDVYRKQCLVILCLEDIPTGTDIHITSPNGYSATTTLNDIRNLDGTPCEHAPEGHLVRIPWHKGMVSQAEVFFAKDCS